MNQEMENLRKQAEQFFELEKFQEIIDLLNDDLLENYKDAHLYAWRARAEYRLNENENENTLHYAQKAIEADPTYFMAYYARSNAWSDKGEYDKAIEDCNKAIQLKPDDATVYYNRGYIWNNKSEYDKAIEDYNKAIELKPDDETAYYNRGNAWYNKDEYDKAIEDYNKAIELNHRVKDAKWMINSIREKQAAGLSEPTKERITKIKTILNIIRKISRSGDHVKQVVHYSKLSVADIISNDCHSCLHYSNAIYMNDPEEGLTFLKYLADEKIKDWYDAQSRKNESTIFLGSFLPLQENNNNSSDALGSSEDQLLMWRTYGKDEEGTDAAGCNFVISSSFFQTGDLRPSAVLPKTFVEIKAAIEKGIPLVDEREDVNALLKVQYITNGGRILNEQGDLLKELIDYFKEEIKILIEPASSPVRNIGTDKIFTDKSVYNAIQELSHLFKSSDYSFENEVRVIRSESRNGGNFDYYRDKDGKEPKSPKHFYVKSESRILPYLDKIFLGPKVKNPHHWNLHFDYSFRKAAGKEDRELKRLNYLETKNDKNGEEIKELEDLKKIYGYSKDVTVKKIDPDQIEIIPSKCRFI